MTTLLTVGHGRLDGSELTALLIATSVTSVVDIRRYPGSRTNPDVGRDALVESLPLAGIGYRWEERLGGRRKLPAGEAPEDSWWTVASFAAYAAHTRTPDFVAAFLELRRDIADRRTAVMCSESVWWRCHRRLVADVAVLGSSITVQHLMHDGRLRDHRPSDGARLNKDRHVVWDL